MNLNERKLSLTGILTWILIAIPSLLWEVDHHHSLLTSRGAVLIGTLLVFLIGFLITTRPGCDKRLRIPVIAIQILAALVCSSLQPVGFLPVMLVIVAAQLGAYAPRFSIPIIVFNSAMLGLIERRAGGDFVIYALVYFAFSLFALFSMHVAHSEMEARQSLAEANAELRMTTELLEISSRTSERLRIARDLHDLLGHHLTALSLNLEVASHLSSGDAKESIEKSKAIAKQLLGDVREVVSRLRNDEPVDLTSSLESLRDVMVAPSLHLDFPRELAVADANIAQVALRTVQEIVTNAVRHSGARNLWLKLASADHALSIDARDDGTGVDNVRFGNGLRGLRERVEQVRGTFEVTSMRGHGFSVHVSLPLGGPA
jgi:signal transduction histidine kinase